MFCVFFINYNNYNKILSRHNCVMIMVKLLGCCPLFFIFFSKCFTMSNVHLICNVSKISNYDDFIRNINRLKCITQYYFNNKFKNIQVQKLLGRYVCFD